MAAGIRAAGSQKLWLKSLATGALSSKTHCSPNIVLLILGGGISYCYTKDQSNWDAILNIYTHRNLFLTTVDLKWIISHPLSSLMVNPWSGSAIAMAGGRGLLCSAQLCCFALLPLPLHYGTIALHRHHTTVWSTGLQLGKHQLLEREGQDESGWRSSMMKTYWHCLPDE